jgi:mannose-6-phosphate isomerase-like protein (cupin superfamily)
MVEGGKAGPNKVNLVEKFGHFSEYWQQKIVAEVNDFYVKIAKLQGSFEWHRHEREDELFYLVKGRLLIRLRDREITLNEGDLFVVPKGTEHLPVAQNEAWVMVLEPKTAVNTGDVGGERTVAPEWI